MSRSPKKDPRLFSFDFKNPPKIFSSNDITSELINSVTRESHRFWWLGRQRDTKNMQTQLDALYAIPTSHALLDFLGKFAFEKTLTESCFAEGVGLFMEAANMPYEQRTAFFGSPLLGLHYTRDLSDQWDTVYPIDDLVEDTGIHHFFQIGPDCWRSSLIRQDQKFFVYCGTRAAEALDSLFQGPTTIDCGMFTQLAILFGMRYVLGNEKFNRLYENKALIFGQFPSEKLIHASGGDNVCLFLDNPLHAFFIEGAAAIPSDAKIHLTQVDNHPDYYEKHPAGTAITENCVVIGGKYCVFNPRACQTCLTESALYDSLAEAFNADRDRHDATIHVRLLFAEKNPEQKKLLIEQYEAGETRKITHNDIPRSRSYDLSFDFQRFCQQVATPCQAKLF